MSCTACQCIIGNVYTLNGGTCDCGYVARSSESRIGTYLGMSGSIHVFRLHNHVCPACNEKITKNLIKCEEFSGLDVTEEFNNISEPFGWVELVGRQNKYRFIK